MRILLLFCALTLPAYAIPVPNIETTADLNDDSKSLAPFTVPKGTVNLALGKKVTSSDDAPIIGELSLITDGDKDNDEGHWVELGLGRQWVQIDLQKPSQIFGVQIWHYYAQWRVYRDVVVQVSNDVAFIKGVRTIHNDDRDNSSGLGIGTDKEFFESYHGFRIDTRGKNYEGITARYVRLYSRGSSSEQANQYIEVEVIGKPISPLPRANAAKAKPAPHPLSQSELMLWTTKIPPAPYW